MPLTVAATADSGLIFLVAAAPAENEQLFVLPAAVNGHQEIDWVALVSPGWRHQFSRLVAACSPGGRG
jgi:hypothetical protein